MTALNRRAVSATIHCLSGCSIGEVIGMMLGTRRAWRHGRAITVPLFWITLSVSLVHVRVLQVLQVLQGRTCMAM